MADKPILFSGPMVRAILDGRKTQTRRVIKPQPEPWRDYHLEGGCQQADWRFDLGERTEDGKRYDYGLWMHSGFHESRFQRCPYGQPGDRLWARETWWHGDHNYWPDAVDPPELPEPALFYRADKGRNVTWKPSIHMPRWASRLTLTITDVRVERVQDISEADAIAEGCRPSLEYAEGIPCGYGPAVPEFANLWDTINAKRGYGWDANPFVWAISFTAEQRNIDAQAREGGNDADPS